MNSKALHRMPYAVCRMPYAQNTKHQVTSNDKACAESAA
jgi:hypothetical protein